MLNNYLKNFEQVFKKCCQAYKKNVEQVFDKNVEQVFKKY